MLHISPHDVQNAGILYSVLSISFFNRNNDERMSKDLFLYKYMYIYNIYRGTQKSTAAKCVQSYQSFVVTYVQ